MNEHVLERITQATITMEELGELTQALGKYNRLILGDGTLRKDMCDIYQMIKEEIADVEICLEKIKKLNNIEDREIQVIKNYKLNRLNK